ncbi:MAG: hypothetical protein IPJ65_23610 [Archangiaceae bacterium]|nr:hypothetical protein [Archangiaceae bacterium]
MQYLIPHSRLKGRTRVTRTFDDRAVVDAACALSPALLAVSMLDATPRPAKHAKQIAASEYLHTWNYPAETEAAYGGRPLFVEGIVEAVSEATGRGTLLDLQTDERGYFVQDSPQAVR